MLICSTSSSNIRICYNEEMRDFVILFVHVIATIVRLLRPGGVRSVVAESILVKHQLLILNRSRQRAPNLRNSDRLVAGLCALLIRPARLIRSALEGRTPQPGIDGLLSPVSLRAYRWQKHCRGLYQTPIAA
jgi:hypothetical protein